MNPNADPKQIDLSLGEANTVLASLQKQQHGLPGGKKAHILRGIYKLSDENLEYCFAQPGEERPTEFQVNPGSKYTLVRLKRFSTGEQPVEKILSDARVKIGKDKIGWIVWLSLDSSGVAIQPLLAKARLLKKLAKIGISNEQIRPADFKELSAVEALQELHIWTEERTVTGLSEFTPNDSFRQLGFGGKGIKDESLPEVSLNGLKEMSFTETSLSSQAISGFIESNPGLTRVNFRKVNVEAESLVALTKLENLKTLSITECDFDDEDAAIVAQINSLNSLLLQKTDISDNGLKKLSALENLAFLRLGGTQITDEGLRTIGNSFPNLGTLYLWHEKNISNQGIQSLANHPGLQQIHTTKPIDDGLVRTIVEELRRKRRNKK